MTTEKKIAWQYDEFQQVGTDYGDMSEVDKYESRHSNFRDMEAEACQVLDAIDIKDTDILIDFGSGTGIFAILAAKRCRKVHAVDVSQAMIDYAGKKALQERVNNIEFHLGGFLSHEHYGPPVDVIVTTLAFHHLPDFWKGIALKRMNAMLKPGGLLYMRDVILEEANAVENIATFIETLSAKGGQMIKEGTEKHFKEEFSTYDWIMDGLFTKSGFSVKRKTMVDGVLGTYLCIKD